MKEPLNIVDCKSKHRQSWENIVSKTQYLSRRGEVKHNLQMKL